MPAAPGSTGSPEELFGEPAANHWFGIADAGRIRHLTIAPLIAEAIRRIADESSVSSLFD